MKSDLSGLVDELAHEGLRSPLLVMHHCAFGPMQGGSQSQRRGARERNNKPKTTRKVWAVERTTMGSSRRTRATALLGGKKAMNDALCLVCLSSDVLLAKQPIKGQHQEDMTFPQNLQ